MTLTDEARTDTADEATAETTDTRTTGTKICANIQCLKRRPLSEFVRHGKGTGTETNTCANCREIRKRATLKAKGRKRFRRVKRRCRYCGRIWTVRKKGESENKACLSCRQPASDCFDGVSLGVRVGEIVKAMKDAGRTWRG